MLWPMHLVLGPCVTKVGIPCASPTKCGQSNSKAAHGCVSQMDLFMLSVHLTCNSKNVQVVDLYDLNCRYGVNVEARFKARFLCDFIRDDMPLPIKDIIKFYVDGFHSKVHTYKCAWCNSQFRNEASGLPSGSCCEQWMRVANAFKRIMTDMHPSVHRAQVELICQHYNRAQNGKIVKTLAHKAKSNVRQLHDLCAEMAMWQAQYTYALQAPEEGHPTSACSFTEDDVVRWSAEMRTVAESASKELSEATDAWTDYDKLAALQLRVAGMDAWESNAPPQEAPTHGRWHLPLLKYLGRMPWWYRYDNWEDKPRDVFRAMHHRHAARATKLEAQLRADHDFATQLQHAEAGLPIKMLHELTPRLHQAYLQFRDSLNHSDHSLNRTNKKKNAVHARMRRHKAAYVELLRINNAWVAKANDMRADARSPQDPLLEGYTYLDEEACTSVAFDGMFPVCSELPSDQDITGVPFSSRHRIVLVRDRIQRTIEDLVITTCHVRNLLYILHWKTDHLTAPLAHALANPSTWGDAVIMQAEQQHTRDLESQWHQAFGHWRTFKDLRLASPAHPSESSSSSSDSSDDDAHPNVTEDIEYSSADEEHLTMLGVLGFHFLDDLLDGDRQ